MTHGGTAQDCIKLHYAGCTLSGRGTADGVRSAASTLMMHSNAFGCGQTKAEVEATQG